jgi:hypothetical protein
MFRSAQRGAHALAALALLTAVSVSACGDGDEDLAGPTEAMQPTGTPVQGPSVNPADFVTKIDNPYLPYTPGTTFRYEGTTKDGPETVVVEVTRQTKKILGVQTVVVRDTVTQEGQVVEDTFDWFAQDREGNVWYFGEDTKELEEGKVVSTEGSWEAGKDGAEPGIVMKAKPKVGDKYRQEYYKGVAEDRGEVLSLTEKVKVPYGSFTGVLKTKDDTPLEPDVVEEKYYAKGVGFIQELQVKGGEDRLQLVSVDKP